MRAREVAQQVSQYLVDQEQDYEFTHWSEEDLLTYFNDAVRIIAINRKSEFVRDVIVDLKPGTLQQLPAGCAEFVSLTGSVDREGMLLSHASLLSQQATQTLTRAVCGPSASTGYRVRAFQHDLGNLRRFSVQPPVPAGTRARVLVSCFGAPKATTLDGDIPVPEHLLPIVKELMLYYAYGRDTESVPSRERATMHWQNAAMLLKSEIEAPAEAVKFLNRVVVGRR